MSSGTVKWFNDEKGFGFITPADGTKDLFVHRTAVKSPGFKPLSEGDKVSFQVASGQKGLQATDVVVEYAD